MRAVKYRELRRMYESLGATVACRKLSEAIEAKHLRATDFSIRELAEAFLGAERVRAMDPRRGTQIIEAGDGVDVTAFSNITGQIVYSAVLDAYQNPAFWATAAVKTMPTRLDGEKIPGMTRIKDDDLVVRAGMPYTNADFGEDYIEVPSSLKRGRIVPVTKEAIFFDRTNLVLERAREVGNLLGLNKEKRILDMILGCASTFATGGKYNWKGVEYTVYSTGSGTVGVAGEGTWDNTATNELIDYTDVDEVMQMFAKLTDPHTGEPIVIDPAAMKIVVMPSKGSRAKSILNATQVLYGIPSATTAQTLTTSPNPLRSYPLIGGEPTETALAQARLVASGIALADAAKYWYVGDFAKAFAYMEQWPLSVEQAPSNSEAEFTQDIVVRYKASERGACAVLDPRYVVQSTGAS